jgi:hypothetical protein
VTEQELKRCRAVHRALSVRLQQLKARLRTVIVDQDILGLGSSVNVTSLLMHDDDKIRSFDHCIRLYTAQVFDGFLKDTAVAEVEHIVGALPTVMCWLAEHAIADHLRPLDAWNAIAGGYDTVTRRDRISAFALEVVLPKAQADEDELEAEEAEA